MMKAILVPLDNRPVTYLFPQLVCDVAGVESIVPPRQLMGSLAAASSLEAISQWLLQKLTASPCDALIVCLDSFLYGGLIASRRVEAASREILERAASIARWRRTGGKLLTVFAQASIMRISDNYDAGEEKPYWSRYGRELFAWSEMLHKLHAGKLNHESELALMEARIDPSVRRDYLATRQRNFQINQALIEYVKSGEIDFLVFSQDDSGEFGLNVMERDKLLAESRSKGIRNVTSYAGADEVISTLIARWLVHSSLTRPRLSLKFNLESGANMQSRYEGQTISQTVQAQMAAAGFGNETAAPVSAGSEPAQPVDFTLLVHTSGNRQGDHITLPGHPDLSRLDTKSAVDATVRILSEAKTPVVLCDVAYANGSDPLLVEQLLSRKDLLSRLWGYAGWNTTGNTTGSALALGAARWYALRNQPGPARDEALRRAFFVRLADDFAYQSMVRRQLSGNLSDSRLQELMQPYLERIKEALDFDPGAVKLSLPWNRSFEVEIDFERQPSPCHGEK